MTWWHLFASVGIVFSTIFAWYKVKMQPESQPLPETPMDNPQADKVYDCAKLSLGEHLTLDPSVPDEVGCCEAVSFVLKQAGYDVGIKGIPGVNALITWLLESGKFKEVSDPQPGCIITSHSLLNHIPVVAHAGVVLQHGIGSNNSWTGLFQENYTISSWEHYFLNVNNCDERFFLPVIS